jgi:GNAT superfamily N-acetyltransferase
MHDWWPNSQTSKEWRPEDVNTGWKRFPNEPITHWLNVEDFLKERYPEAATGSQYGSENAGEVLAMGQHSGWDVPPDVLEEHGYTGVGNVVTQAMLNLHNKLQGRTWNTENDKHRYYELMLKHVGPGAKRLSKLIHAYRTGAIRLAGISDQPDNVTDDYSLAEFFQWCAHNHLKPNQAALDAYSQVSGIGLQDYEDLSSFLDSLDMSGDGFLDKVSRSFWAMTPAEDAYDQNPSEEQRAQAGMPLRENASGKWYHVSPHKMEPDTILSPGGGTSPYNHNNDSMPTQRQKDWVWMDGPDAVKQWYYGTLMGQIQQGNENPWAHIYEVEPSEGPHPWNGSGDDGHVAPSARILREIATDKYNRLPDSLEAPEAPKTASLRFWAMADTTQWHPLIKHEPYGVKSGIYHISLPNEWSATGDRIGDLSYSLHSKGDMQYSDESGSWKRVPSKFNQANIYSLIVHPDHQGKGVAQALVERLHKDFPDHKINPGPTTPEGHGFTKRMLETAPDADEKLAPNYKPHILDDDDVQQFNTGELNRLVNAATMIVEAAARTASDDPDVTTYHVTTKKGLEGMARGRV